MAKICKTLIATTATFFVFAGSAWATSVGANGSVDFYLNIDYAIDAAGNTADGNQFIETSGQSSLVTSSAVATENGISSNANSSIFSFTNISDVFSVYWSANLQVFTSASARSFSTALGEYYFDSNSFVSLGNMSSFSSTNGSLICSDNNPNSPNYNCFGYSQGFRDSAYDYMFGLLAPGETISIELSVQSFATTRFKPISPVPLPAAGFLLGFAVLVLGAAKQKRRQVTVA